MQGLTFLMKARGETSFFFGEGRTANGLAGGRLYPDNSFIVGFDRQGRRMLIKVIDNHT